MKIGIMGGTFDPVHLGHLSIAHQAAEELGLDSVLFIPAGQPWMKAAQPVTDKSHRLNMVNAAIKTNPTFQVNDMEIRREGNTYSADTVEQLRQKYGGATELFFIMGTEVLECLPQWKKPETILEHCTLAIVARSGKERPSLLVIKRQFPESPISTALLSGPQIEISSSEIRVRAQKGLPINRWVPSGVLEYIENNGLYRP